MDEDILGIVSMFVREGVLDQTLIDVGPSFDRGLIPLMKIRGYTTNVTGASFLP